VNRFVLLAPIERVWPVMTDLSQLVPCLPGVRVDDVHDGVHRGVVTIKMGPVAAEYRGTAEFLERDEHARRAVIDCQVSDTRGEGNAQAIITSELAESDGQTHVQVRTELVVSGRAANFGNKVIQEVSDKFTQQFEACLAARIEGTTMLESVAQESASLAADGADADTLDLVDVAGGAVLKRLVPLAVAFLVAVVLLIMLF